METLGSRYFRLSEAEASLRGQVADPEEVTMDDTARRSDFNARQDKLAGRAAIVTGSTSGIGLGIARAFAGAGMNVMLNGLDDNHDIDETRLALEAEFGITA